MLKCGFLNLSKTLGIFAAKSCISLLHLPSQLRSASYLMCSILWAFVDLLSVVMNASVLFDKVSLVNLSESTPNSVLGLWYSCFAKEAANFLLFSSDL